MDDPTNHCVSQVVFLAIILLPNVMFKDITSFNIVERKVLKIKVCLSTPRNERQYVDRCCVEVETWKIRFPGKVVTR